MNTATDQNARADAGMSAPTALSNVTFTGRNFPPYDLRPAERFDGLCYKLPLVIDASAFRLLLLTIAEGDPAPSRDLARHREFSQPAAPRQAF